MSLSVRPSRSCSLREDVVGPHHRVLQVRAGFALEAERLLDVEHNQLAARILQHEIADRGRRQSATPTRWHSSALKSGFRLATSADALSVSRSSRSSIFTPRPLRPETSTNGFLRASLRRPAGLVAELARRGVRQRHHLIGEMDRVLGFPRVAERAQRLAEQRLQVHLPGIDHVVDPLARGRTAGRRARRSRRSSTRGRGRRPARRSGGSGSRGRAARTSRTGSRCLCRRR